MRKNRQLLLWLGFSLMGVLTLSPALLGQDATGSEADGPVISDWSQHHLIFSKPATEEQAERLKDDFRYRQQLLHELPVIPQLDNGGLDSGLQFDTESTEEHIVQGDWSENMGSGAKVGAINYPAKYGFRVTSASCGSAAHPDFVVYTTSLTGAAKQASIVAYDNLYSGCTGTVPSIYWAYDTNGGKITTSPVFSSDGKQLAFVQTDASGNGNLVLLKWSPSASETVTNPGVLMRVSNTVYPLCVAPCMTTALLSNATGIINNADTNSSVFYDYSNDIAYIGDAAGWLHKFTPVFNGIPAEVKAAGWPVQVNPVSPTALTGAVYDPNSGRVFVADAGGFVYRVGPSTAFVATSTGPLDFSLGEGGAGFVQGPVVDSTAEVLYAFSSSDGSKSCTAGADCAAVFQLGVNFPQGANGTKAKVGASTVFGTAPNPLYLGTFDSAYQNSVGGTGNLYVCGNTGGDPAIYQVALTSAVFGTITAGPLIANHTVACSPMSTILNPNAAGGATEWMYVSAENAGISTPCGTNGCIFGLKNTPWLPSTVYAVGQEVMDSHFQIQVVTTAGTSGVLTPSWSTTTGATTTDGGVHWLDQGKVSANTPLAWTANHSYSKGNIILDPNGNIELVTSTGSHASGGTIPTFNTIAGGTTNDGVAGLVWTNAGAFSIAAAREVGGTSGVVMDNTVGSGTLAGASQVYFSTLGTQTCGTTGTGGCAVQASQAALK